VHSVLPPNYKRLRHRELVALPFHGLDLEHEIESFLSVMPSCRMHRTDYCIMQIEETHFALVVSSISSKSVQYFTLIPW